VKIDIRQSVDAEPAGVLAAYGSPGFYTGRPTRDDIAVVEIVSHDDSGHPVRMDVRFTFKGNVSPAVRAVIDSSKMSWVTRMEIHPEAGKIDWKVVPDHYPDRLSARGSYVLTSGPQAGSTQVAMQGELKVHVPIVGRSVERVIVSGLRKYFEDEVASIPDFDGH
jgi:hypothetical protein